MKQVAEILNNLKKTLKGEEPRSPIENKTPHCSICQDRGVVIIDGEKARICDCVKQVHRELRYEHANISPEIKNHLLEDFQLKYYHGEHRQRAARVLNDARQFVNDYLENHHRSGLLITGDVGAGKTFIAGAITNFLLKEGVQVLFLVVPDFLDTLRATYSKGGAEGDEATLIREARQVDVLVLDDLGVHNYTPWTCNKIYSLLNYRMNYRLPVVITTNLDLFEIEKHLGKRTTSRIVQMCSVYRLTVDQDIRYQKSLESKS